MGKKIQEKHLWANFIFFKSSKWEHEFKICNKIDKWKQQTNEKPRRHNEETFSVNLLNEYDEMNHI